MSWTEEKHSALLRHLVTVMALAAVALLGATVGYLTAREDRDEAVVFGAGQAWAVINECYEAPSDCDAILAEVNGDGDGVKFFEDGSAYLTKDEHLYK